MADATKYTSKLSNTRILIIGASSGLGFGVAEACTEHGALVVGASSNPSRLEAAVTKIQAAYPSKKQNIHGLVVNLSDLDTVETELSRLFEEAVSKIGGSDRKLDHVIFTAGDALSMMKIQDMEVEKVVRAGAIRFFAPLLAAKFVQRYLTLAPSSSYTITTGSVSERPMPNWSVIASYAGGIHSMVRSLAVDLAPVRVNGISPGAVITELWNGLPEEERKRTFSDMEKKMLTGRMGRVEDVVESFLGVLKDANITGSVVRSDGGGLIV